MESCPPNQRSFSSQHPEEAFGASLHSRHRQPLASSAGNSQHALHHLDVSRQDDKVVPQNQVERPPVSYIVPSQPPRQSLGGLERRQSIRRQRQNRFSSTHNPIANSPQYQAYRNRQRQEGNDKDQKWPAILEEAFLDALILIPKMGRRKFSMDGKPHGRNELISAYLWIAYKQSLGPGEVPDEEMRRARKQVSSHIQVLKAFLKNTPAGERLFAKSSPTNGFEDSFKNDPVLNALQAGRLYSPYAVQQQQSSPKPVVFWILITQPSKPGDNSRRYTREGDIYQNGALVHKYTGLHSRSHHEKENLENILNWREKFPYFAQNLASNEMNYALIHMDVSLALMDAPLGSDLVTRMEMVIPSPAYGKHRWQAVTTLSRPPELYYENQDEDRPLNRSALIVEPLDVNSTHTRIKVPFPANTWAHVLTCLMKIQNSYEEGQKDGTSASPKRARDYMDQISMYQELQSARVCTECSQGETMGRLRSLRCNCGGRGNYFETRAILLWTFNKARRGDQGSTTWRYINPTPPRRVCMSPSPHPPHPSRHITSTMNEHFNSWAEPTHLQTQHILDPFNHSLATPPHTASLQAPFLSSYAYTANNFDVSQDNMSFLSHTTAVDGESTIMDHDNTPTIDSFLSNASAGLGDFDQSSQAWNLPHTESFDPDPVWAYNVPTSTPQMRWENESKSHIWPLASPSKGHAWPGSDNSSMKQGAWADEAQAKNEHEHLWNNVLPIPALGQKLDRWIETHGQEEDAEKTLGFHDERVTQLGDLRDGTQMSLVGSGVGAPVKWSAEEGFGYKSMDDSMK